MYILIKVGHSRHDVIGPFATFNKALIFSRELLSTKEEGWDDNYHDYEISEIGGLECPKEDKCIARVSIKFDGINVHRYK